eukprot:CAMPEP_0194224598 /NCGR_PEP_ID=MMETSP0156-20130528/37885_1 /TAXON_ID=33649 /ORGANISM="Thalassionema nitzschioides, Strain L26-B" /LENGTH=133 /DNA_ID=CAMNT_0038956241 /DNA_START=22 /DNA_END=423 /DNA_ORIENTATION=+
MTMKKLLLIHSLLPSMAVLGWGSPRNTFKVGTALMGMEYDDLDAFRANLELTFQSNQGLPEIFQENVREDLVDYIGRTASEDVWSFDDISSCGEECEECLIPDHFKASQDVDQIIDVLDFLGIKRAKPLRAED